MHQCELCFARDKINCRILSRTPPLVNIAYDMRLVVTGFARHKVYLDDFHVIYIYNVNPFYFHSLISVWFLYFDTLLSFFWENLVAKSLLNSSFSNKNVLFLQGPVGPFFRRLAKDLQTRDNKVYKINFNGGDYFFFPQASNYRESIEKFPEFFVFT